MNNVPQVWGNNFNGSNALTANVAGAFIFKNAAGVQTRAKEIFIRIDAGVSGDLAKINYRLNLSGTPVAPTTAQQFLDVGGWMTQIKCFAASIGFLTVNANCVAYIDAYSDEDISGTAFV